VSKTLLQDSSSTLVNSMSYGDKMEGFGEVTSLSVILPGLVKYTTLCEFMHRLALGNSLALSKTGKNSYLLARYPDQSVYTVISIKIGKLL
jgi:hypothetical protein